MSCSYCDSATIDRVAYVGGREKRACTRHVPELRNQERLERPQERLDILHDVDAQECQTCHTPVPFGATGEETLINTRDWRIETKQIPNESDPESPVTIAEIFCPRCC